MIHFQIDESIAHSQIPISSNHGVLFQIKRQCQFRNLENCRSAGRKNVGVQEEEAIAWSLSFCCVVIREHKL